VHNFLPRPTEPRDRLIFALDVPDIETAEHYVKKLKAHVGTFKIGPGLLTLVGPEVIDLVHDNNAGVFLDLKFHDIPATVGAAAREASRKRVRMFTVHALGGKKMIEEAAGELLRTTIVPGIPRPLCLAVTVLTSHEEKDLAAIGLPGPIPDLGLRLAKLAVSAGASGIVASPHEIAKLKAELPEHIVYVVPGIRGPNDAKSDQSRVMTAKEAVQAGATYIVVGRPIRDAADPAAAAKKILDEISGS
jgi:orotidine-5'-phosphate decarboxylase